MDLEDFDILRVGRLRLQEFCARHRSSVEFFRSGESFRLDTNEGDLGTALRHMTSTATCLESLQDCPDARIIDSVKSFVQRALQAEDRAWTSEDSAAIYCRCRALPLMIPHAHSFTHIQAHVERIIAQLKTPDRFAVGEADVTADSSEWYPPNAFHTFWTLEILDLCGRHFGMPFQRFAKSRDIRRNQHGMILWAWQVLGCQVALHKADSSALDTDQLAWAIAIVTRPEIADASPFTLRYRDLLNQAIETFFAAQDSAWTWHHHEPLFHYRKSGNAYCYVFETLAAFLRNAVRPQASTLRALLRPHAPRLLRLLDYVQATQISLGPAGAIGWASGHRTNVPYAEGWATAAIFSCMQRLRRLVGIWTREHVLTQLNYRRHNLTPAEGERQLITRGETWSKTDSVADQLLTMFVYPTQRRRAADTSDPDDRPIDDQQMRSAILFGPPGTSKTTLARSVAAAIGWDYVEMHSSHFVAEGLPNVQRTADKLFAELMQLDRCVVLFDEIDDLVRERDREADAFGRFLTNSMLPKLAELWTQRRLIYFVATNHISYFDHALTRTQRFDALLFVPPPSFTAKTKRLVEIIHELVPKVRVKITITRDQVEKALSGTGSQASKEGDQGRDSSAPSDLHEEHLLAKFLLLRWDQLDELGYRLARQIDSAKVTSCAIDSTKMKSALKGIEDPRLREYKTYQTFLSDRDRGMRDFGKETVWRIVGTPPQQKAFASSIRAAQSKNWYVGTKDVRPEVTGVQITFPGPGSVEFTTRSTRRPGRSRKSGKPVLKRH